MDWIEQVFHVDPDGGSGMLELALVVLVAAVIAIVASGAWRYRGRRRSKVDVRGSR
jgi:Tfp pilus assembly protein PilE